jgi:signal transduction histidine kinase
MQALPHLSSRRTQSAVIAGVVLAAAVSALRVGAWIGATVPGFVLTEEMRPDRVGDPLWGALRLGMITRQDQIIGMAVDGRPVPIHSPDDVNRVVAALPVGAPVTYTVDRNGRRIVLTIPTARFSGVSFLALYGCSVLPALAAFLVVWWTVARRPRHPASRPLLLLSAAALAGNLSFCEATVNGRFRGAYEVSQYLIGAAFVNLALHFPWRRRVVVQLPWLPAALFAATAGAGVLITALRWTAVLVDPIWGTLSAVTLAGGGIFFGLATAHSNWTFTDRVARERARVVLFGFTVSGLLLGIGLLPGMLTRWMFPANLFFPLSLIMTGCLVYAIVRGNLLDLRHVLRRRSLTVVLALAWAAAYVVAALLVEQAFTAGSPWVLGLQAVILVIGSFTFPSARSRLEHWMDGLFFRARAAYKPTVQELSASFTRMLRADEVLRHTERIVGQTIPGTTVQVCGLAAAVAPLPRELLVQLRNTAVPVCAATHPDTAAELEACGAEVAVPLTFEGNLRAALLLGPKRSGELYTSEDFDLLSTIANQAAIALENARSFEALDALRQNLEHEVEVRTRELRDTQTQLVHVEKMASLGQLVAGVAHELNNPLGAVDGNLEVLRDYVARLRAALAAYEKAAPQAQLQFDAVRRQLGLNEVIADLDPLLATCAEGSHRARRIVQDLRTFSRLDEAELKRVDLNAAIRVTLDLLRHRVRGGIQLETTFGPLPEVECYASQLNQVFLNLLTNALDAVESAGGGTVRISTQALSNGGDTPSWVEIAVQDSGPGVPPEVRNKIFDPFFTTKPIGKGTGLGLSISYSIVVKHGGRLTVDPSPPPGCTFRLRLPLQPTL